RMSCLSAREKHFFLLDHEDEISESLEQMTVYSHSTLPPILRQSCHPFSLKAATDSHESCHPPIG
ncbi:MAG: hypothetical protein AB2805_10680, partial [Candidatus Thiodiazotropha sp.]